MVTKMAVFLSKMLQSIFVNTIQIGKHKDWQLRRNSVYI